MPYNFLKRVNSRKLFICHFRRHSRPQNSNICTNDQLISSQTTKKMTKKMNQSIQDHICMTIFSDLIYIYIYRYCKVQAVFDGKIHTQK